jgi:tryptophanyl-tRNA synthetase
LFVPTATCGPYRAGFEETIPSVGKSKRVLSGMRPTGRLHLGHYFGALSNWLKLQEEYDCFFFVADWHALTTHYQDASSVAENTLQVAIDWLAACIDPAKSTIFIQSSVLEHAELYLLLSMITPLSWLERVPTYKEQIDSLKDRDLGTFGFLGYPLLQSADIVIYDADLVPVGEDQVPHVELTREVVRRFNTHFGLEMDAKLFAADHAATLGAVFAEISKEPVELEKLKEREFQPWFRTAVRKHVAEVGFANFLASLKRKPKPSISGSPDAPRSTGEGGKFFKLKDVLVAPNHLLTETPRLPGTDGRRMAKSYGNAIWLSDTPDAIGDKVRNMMTDPQRVKRTDPGRPEICPVFAYHKLFSPPEIIAWSAQGCRTAGIGCVECKKKMADGLVGWIAPIQERRKELEAHPQQVWDILDAGGKKARRAARRTMKRVRNAIFKLDQARKPGPVV